MTLLLAIISAMFVAASLVIVARLADAASWRRSLVTYELGLPNGLTVDDVAAWLGRVAASTHAPRFWLLPMPPVALRVIGEQGGIRHELSVPNGMSSAVLSGLRAALPGIRVTETDMNVYERPLVAAEARLTSRLRPLAIERAEVTSAHLLASLSPVGPGEQVRVEWILTGAGTPVPIRSTTPAAGLLQELFGNEQAVDSDELRAARLKQRDPLLHAVVRVGVVAGNRPTAYRLFGRTWGALRGMNAPGVQLVRRWLPSLVVAARMDGLRLPVLHWPLLVGTHELAGLLGLASGARYLPGVSAGAARQLPPSPAQPTRGTVFAVSTYPGMTGRPLALATADRLRHTWVLGPTGVGKSTLLANLIRQDMEAGRGLVVLDPKGDLVTDALARVPEQRRNDVLVLDPSATDRPVGVNVLATRADELHRELAVDTLVHTMSSLWRSSWGPRTSDVIRSALLTLVHTRAQDGSPFTVVELPELLLQPRFRTFVTNQPSVPPTVRSFWTAYEQMSDGERAQVIGPSLNKLRSLTTRSSLRLMLGQARGIDLDEVFTRKRIILVPLAKGVLGQETTALIGSLLMAQLWEATLARVTVAPERRHPVMFYLDEFQDFLRLPLGLADMLSQARGLGAGLVLAHQYLGQLTEDVKLAVLGTARSQAVFQVEHDDARALAPRFAPLTAEDLQGLAAHEIALRPCIDGATARPVTGLTLPQPDAVVDGAALARASRERFGVARVDVEAALQDRLTGADRPTQLGRERHGGRP
jgi:hypothetical protein